LSSWGPVSFSGRTLLHGVSELVIRHVLQKVITSLISLYYSANILGRKYASRNIMLFISRPLIISVWIIRFLNRLMFMLMYVCVAVYLSLGVTHFTVGLLCIFIGILWLGDKKNTQFDTKNVKDAICVRGTYFMLGIILSDNSYFILLSVMAGSARRHSISPWIGVDSLQFSVLNFILSFYRSWTGKVFPSTHWHRAISNQNVYYALKLYMWSEPTGNDRRQLWDKMIALNREFIKPQNVIWHSL
jgi:hypothetical protein